jgi:polysaccharide pyruvyl transferase WcaK-like protein
MKNILIDNTGFINKGAELMLRSVVANFANNENVRLVHSGQGANSFLISNLGMYSLATFQRFKIDFSKLFSERKFLDYGLVLSRNIDVVLDAGGFQFGDQWVKGTYIENRIKQKIDYYRDLQSKGVTLIFLPQALGSFNNPLSRKLFIQATKASSLVIARDKQSYDYAKEVLPSDEKLRLFPDFTNIYQPKVTTDFENFSNKICLIPNSKMITHSDRKISESYIQFFKELVPFFKGMGEEVFFLNHEGKEDLDLINKINTGAESVLTGLNADQVKLVIGKSKLLVSSRFHGVVSGLSQAVPTFCTSWSHKYEELMKDYDFQDGLLKVDNLEHTKKIFLKYLEQKELIKLLNHLDKLGQIEKEKSKKMWQEIETIIDIK